MSSSSMNVSNPIDAGNLFSAKGLSVVITGGGTGIGHAIASALASSGADFIFLLGRRLLNLQSVAEGISASTSTKVVPVQCDVSDLQSVRAASNQISKVVGHVDVLINNAGINGPAQPDLRSVQSIEELSEVMLRDWDLVAPTFATNSSSVLAVSAVFLPLLDKGNRRRGWVVDREKGAMIRKQKGEEGVVAEAWDDSDERRSQIISVASISGFNREVTAGLAYTGSKAAAIHLGKTLANLLVPWGVRSNVIAPGRFPSEMTAGGLSHFPIHQIPHGSQGTFEDVAGLILYLVGRSGAYVNGNVQVFDGGRLSVMPATY